MFTTLHFWVGFACGAGSMLLTLGGGLYMLSRAAAGSMLEDEEDRS